MDGCRDGMETLYELTVPRRCSGGSLFRENFGLESQPGRLTDP